MMHSKWADACSQALAFDQVGNHVTALSHDEWCRHIIHLFSQARRLPLSAWMHARSFQTCIFIICLCMTSAQLSAMATLHLHVKTEGLSATHAHDAATLGQRNSSMHQGSESRTSCNLSKRRSLRTQQCADS